MKNYTVKRAEQEADLQQRRNKLFSNFASIDAKQRARVLEALQICLGASPEEQPLERTKDARQKILHKSRWLAYSDLRKTSELRPRYNFNYKCGACGHWVEGKTATCPGCHSIMDI